MAKKHIISISDDFVNSNNISFVYRLYHPSKDPISSIFNDISEVWNYFTSDKKVMKI